MMRKIIFILSVISFGISAAAQENYLSREAYRDKVEAYSQLLKQQRLKATASTEARKIAQTGFLPKIDITAEGTANLSHLEPGTVRRDSTVLTPIRHWQHWDSLFTQEVRSWPGKRLPKPMKSWTNLPQS